MEHKFFKLTFGNWIQIILLVLAMLAAYYKFEGRLTATELLAKNNKTTIDTNANTGTDTRERLIRVEAKLDALIAVAPKR